MKPIAWMYEYDGIVPDIDSSSLIKTERWEAGREEPWTETPLYAIPEGFALVPKEPTVETLDALVRSKYPEDWEAGKKLQKEQVAKRYEVDKIVPHQCEYEIAVGKWERAIAAAEKEE